MSDLESTLAAIEGTSVALTTMLLTAEDTGQKFAALTPRAPGSTE